MKSPCSLTRSAAILATATTLCGLTTNCASSQSKPIASPCVQAPAPIIHRCPPPPEPTRLETQTDLLLAYIDALSAWTSCRLEVERLIKYFEEVENADKIGH